MASPSSPGSRPGPHAYQGLNAIMVIFPIGLIFGLAYWKWRRLWPLFVAHALLDLYALLPAMHRA